MDKTESDIMKDAFMFLKEHDPPPPGGAASRVFWEKAARDVAEAGERWNNHPLSLEVFPAVYTYIERKQAAKRKH